MKNSRKFLLEMLTLLSVLLAACGNSGDDSNSSLDHTISTEDSSDDSTNAVSSEIVDTSKNDPAQVEDPSSNNTATSLKEEYLQKLNDTKKETDEMRNNPTDESTTALKDAESEIYDIWDGLLNEIYGVLKQQLPSEDMDQLREAQRKWIDYRDQTALEASLKYKGGTMEHLEYVVVLNYLTEERCFELVEDYMK
ncbi:lysozyme inhibitor LprI family protein [Ureibacillus sp. GCM10028918]|uniref:lysozyme inhibitor LprI family protein n=1 Tax=Ureibacillus sp. GCM10028918 TaxID=3273429 RepID=UPI003624629D